MKILSIIICISFCNLTYSQTYYGSLTISDQAALDTFNYEIVTGILIIEATDTINNKITDLSPLSTLKRVHSNFALHNIHATDYTPLGNLEFVGKSIFIDNCRFQDLTFLNNPDINEGISIRNMPNLTTLNGLQFLTYAKIVYLWNLGISDFSGLDNLEKVEQFLFQPNSSNPVLTSTNGLQSLKKAKTLDIRASTTFSSEGLISLDSVEVLYFHQLEDFSHMNLKYARYIYCYQCEMTDFQGLEGVRKLGDIDDGSGQAGLNIYQANSLINTKGLENVNEARSVSIVDCPLLYELNFNALDSVYSFTIRSNPILESISKSGIPTYTEYLGIWNNYALIDCCALTDILSNPNLNPSIFNNPFPCNSDTTILSNCNGSFTWTGTAGTTIWGDPANWEGNVVPDETNSTLVIIPSNPAGNIFPEINIQDRIINKLVVGESGEITIDGKMLHVSSPDSDIIVTILGKLLVLNNGLLRIGN